MEFVKSDPKMQRNDLRLLARKKFDQWQIDNYLAHMVLWQCSLSYLCSYPPLQEGNLIHQ
jgi:hypothetical protein